MTFDELIQQAKVARSAFNEEIGRGPDDQAKMFYKVRDLQGEDDDAPRMDKTMGEHPLVYRIRENLGIADKPAMEARAQLGMEMKQTPAGRIGQLAGAAGADLIQDKSRSIWWLLNAAQATANVGNDYALKYANPALFGARDLNTPFNITDLKAKGLTRTTDSGRLVPAEGVYGANGKAKKRNYRSGMVHALGAPVGFAVNSGMGLMTPFGGYEGYEAAVPSAEDPSKTDNAVLEVASKYILGRTGNLLDWDEFKKVRPDVSKGEYNAYKAFKYDKAIDMNPFDDGDISLPGGVLRGTTDGIHGAELQFLGRSLPVNTALLPTAVSILGTMAGVRRGKKYRPGGELAGEVDPDAVRRGLMGGAAGAVGGMAIGNTIEAERRKRNEASNQAYYDTLEGT
tara:strand:- start:4150 stop:5343 length:1194 start_codon:yes stop_codon:yes gene_type:complete